MTADPNSDVHVVSALRQVAADYPDRAALIHLPDGSSESLRLTYRELVQWARKVAGNLQGEGLARKPVIVAASAGPFYTVGVLACMFADAIAVPMPELWSRRWEAVLPQIRAAAILTSSDSTINRDAMTGRHIIEIDKMSSVSDWEDQPRSLDDTAFVQFTSGTTGAPKGVVISHRALSANGRMIRAGFGSRDDVRAVSWLPPWHDMGLVGGLLHPLAAGETVVTMPPLIAIQRPVRWLRAIHKFDAIASGGPLFAYANCVARIDASELRGLDLSSWELAYCGAEPIRPEPLFRFADKFRDCGFNAGAFAPCYGLAEATLFVTGSEPRKLRTIKVDAQELAVRKRAVITGDGRELISCGQPQAGGDVQIHDVVNRSKLSEGLVGEIVVAGPHLASGFWETPDDESEIFEKVGAIRQLRTGDLGFLLDGELYVTGRLKDVIIVRGVKYHAEDIELAAIEAHSSLRNGAAVAFSIDFWETEVTIVVVEISFDEIDGFDVEARERIVHAALLKECGIRPEKIIFVRTGILPRTTSGKIERYRCRELYEGGRWPPVALSSASQFPIDAI